MEKIRNGEGYLREYPQGSVLGPLFFLVYINDLVENINSDVKLFAHDTSLFSVVENVTRSADELNRDLERVRLWDTMLEGSRLEGSRLEIQGSKARGSKARHIEYFLARDT